MHEQTKIWIMFWIVEHITEAWKELVDCESKNVIDATNVPSELGYEYEMWFWFDPFISNKKCAVCITWKGFAKMLHFVPSKNLPSVS